MRRQALLGHMLGPADIAVHAAADWIRHVRVDTSRMCVVALDELAMLLSLPDALHYQQRAELYQSAIEHEAHEVAFVLLEEPVTSDAEFEPERPLTPGGRPLSLGERKSLARGPRDQRWLNLIADPHPQVVEIILENPHLTETDVITMASRRPVTSASLLPIFTNRRFRTRPRVKRALALNPSTPSHIVARLVLSITDADVRDVARDRSRPAPLRLHARRILDIRL